MKCSKCKKEIVGMEALLNCKSYCSYCFEIEKEKIKVEHRKRSPSAFWDKWIKTPEKAR